MSTLNQHVAVCTFERQALMRSSQRVNELENNMADVMLAAVKRRAWEETVH
jgi:hypothetical protein